MMTAFYQPKDSKNFFREILIYSEHKEQLDDVVAFLTKTDLALKEMSVVVPTDAKLPRAWIRCFSQSNIGASRKQLQPFLSDFYRATN